MNAAQRREAGHVLAGAFLRGNWEEDGMVARAGRAFGHLPRWVRRVAREVLAAYARPPLDRPRELAAYVAIVLEEIRAPAPGVERWPLFHPETVRRPWPVPRIDTVGELAALLGVDDGRLAWLADARGLERVVADERLRRYRYAWLPRESGPARVIERPKAHLKAIQRRLLDELLVWIPVHPAVHGFVRGRSARTHAAVHTGRPAVLRVDVEDFFAAVAAGRVYGIFRAAGYPEAVAHALTGLCTNVVPREWEVPAQYRLRRRLATPHLPQGAPTSPALANLAAFRLDCRLAGLAVAVGARYTRYADDLVLSGSHALRGLAPLVAEIAAEEGFRANSGKTRLMSRAGRQTVTGIVVNERPNVPRADYDWLKAVLHRAARDGPGELDRAHVLGRIAWVESLNPARGAKLRRRAAEVDWG